MYGQIFYNLYVRYCSRGSRYSAHGIQGGQEIWTTHADYVNHAGRGYRDFGTPVFIVNLFTV